MARGREGKRWSCSSGANIQGGLRLLCDFTARDHKEWAGLHGTNGNFHILKEMSRGNLPQKLWLASSSFVIIFFHILVGAQTYPVARVRCWHCTFLQTTDTLFFLTLRGSYQHFFNMCRRTQDAGGITARHGSYQAWKLCVLRETWRLDCQYTNPCYSKAPLAYHFHLAMIYLSNRLCFQFNKLSWLKSQWWGTSLENKGHRHILMALSLVDGRPSAWYFRAVTLTKRSLCQNLTGPKAQQCQPINWKLNLKKKSCNIKKC